jgi:ribosomal protein S18 acetylase RimI-like enzyme
MNTLTMRSYAGEADLQVIADLINTCEAVDRMDEGTSVSELRVEFDAPSVDKGRDIRLWEDTLGRLIGFGLLWIPQSGEVIDGFLWFRVHPSARGANLETQIITWGEERMREVRQERGVPVKLRSGTRDHQAERITLLESCGFTADRYFFTMERSLDEPIPEPQFPVGFTLRHFRDEDAEAGVQLYNQSFIDHWNYHPLTVERLKHYLSHPNYKPELDLIAIAPDGTFAALCYSKIDLENNVLNRSNDGWIVRLGTRRGFRRMGLARAMLLAGMHRLKAVGMDTAKLGVDAENPLGAGRLYESVGFRKIYTQISYIKDV